MNTDITTDTARRPRNHGRLILSAALLATSLGAGAVTAYAHDTTGDAPHDHASHGRASNELHGRERAAIIEATLPFRDVQTALDAGYVPVSECVEEPGLGGMGVHYLNPALAADEVVDPAKPEMLLYSENARGELVLVGAEWFVVDGDQDLSTDDDRPSLWGHPFDGPMPGHGPDMPVHYDLHAWVWAHNPSGDLAPFNPRLSCD